MRILNSLVSLETKTSVPVLIGSTRIRLASQVLRIKIPFWQNGELVWNRPTSVTAQIGSEPEQVFPVVDITRIAQVAIVAGGIAAAVIVALATRRHP